MGTKHTPTPWDIDVMGYIRGPESENILENHDNAAFIVRAVNRDHLFEELLRSAKEFTDHYDYEDGVYLTPLLEAIAKAEGK